jgi:hypothetical protein
VVSAAGGVRRAVGRCRRCDVSGGVSDVRCQRRRCQKRGGGVRYTAVWTRRGLWRRLGTVSDTRALGRDVRRAVLAAVSDTRRCAGGVYGVGWAQVSDTRRRCGRCQRRGGQARGGVAGGVGAAVSGTRVSAARCQTRGGVAGGGGGVGRAQVSEAVCQTRGGVVRAVSGTRAVARVLEAWTRRGLWRRLGAVSDTRALGRAVSVAWGGRGCQRRGRCGRRLVSAA